MPPLLSPYLQRRRFAAILPYLRGDILDLACGDGALIGRLLPDQYYLGVERRPETVARLRARHPGRDFLARDLEHDDLDLGRRFDTALLIAVIEHLQSPDRLLGQIPACLNPGGQLLLTTPTPLGQAVHRLGARLGLFHLGAARDHKQVYGRASLLACAARNGLCSVVYRSFMLGGNQLLICRAEA